MYHQSTPSRGGWPAYDYTTSPPGSPYYQSFYANPTTASPRAPPKRHSRKASYASPRESGWYSAYAQYQEPIPEYASSRKFDNVSASFGQKKRKHRASMPGDVPSHGNGNGFGLFGYDYVHPSRMPKRPIIIDVVDEADDEPTYIYREPRSVRFQRSSYTTAAPRKTKATTDPYSFSTQVPPIYEEDVKRSRARRASTSTRTSPPKPPKMAAPPKSPTKATEADAEAAGIPSGYSIKNWDPDEAPILLLGSVFDANSLGKWIYDWTVYHHGASTPMADVAGELWLLLIKLAGKVKRADEFLERTNSRETVELLEDFLDSGERLWNRFKTLLKDCEQFMYKAAKRETGRSAPVSMGRNAGSEFVESIFGRDRKLHDTEKLMNSIRLWDMRFDANCEAILRPSRRSSRRQSTV